MSKYYTVIIEKGPKNYGASVPDLPGCVSVGHSMEKVTRNIQEAIEFHLEGMREDGNSIPEPSTQTLLIEVS